MWLCVETFPVQRLIYPLKLSLMVPCAQAAAAIILAAVDAGAWLDTIVLSLRKSTRTAIQRLPSALGDSYSESRRWQLTRVIGSPSPSPGRVRQSESVACGLAAALNLVDELTTDSN